MEEIITRRQDWDEILKVPLMLYYSTEQEDLAEVLDELREATVGITKARLEINQGAELVAIKSVRMALHDALKTYRDHNFPIPKLLSEFQQAIEQRHAELDPHHSQGHHR